MAPTQLIASIDIGTSKTVVAVAELPRKAQPRLLGCGMSPTRGMKAGAINNLSEISMSVAAALRQVEVGTGVELSEAYLTVSGAHIQSENARGGFSLTNYPHELHEIDDEDLQKALQAARPSVTAPGQQIILVVPRTFTIDNHALVPDPFGMTAHRLDAETHVVYGSSSHLHNLQRTLPASIEPIEFLVQGIASAEAVATNEERDHGCVVIDIGAGTTDIAVYLSGTIWHSEVLAVGGANVTSDLAHIVRTSTQDAELLKLRYGHALPAECDPDPTITVRRFGGGTHTVSQRHLSEIIEARIEEIFTMVQAGLGRSGLIDALGAGAIITGGCSALPGCAVLAERILGIPVRTGDSVGADWITETYRGPIYAGAIGTLVYFVRQRQFSALPTSKPHGFREYFSRIFGRLGPVSDWVGESPNGRSRATQRRVSES